jgi:YidC/Oxa1 family membrane protein insertase
MKRQSLIVAVCLGLTLFGCKRTGGGAGPVGATAALNGAATADDLKLESADYVATLSARGAALSHFVLKDPRYQREGRPIDLVTTDKPQYLPARAKLEGLPDLSNQIWKAEQLGPSTVRFTLELGELSLVRKFEVGQGAYQLWSTLSVTNRGHDVRTVRATFEGHHYVQRQHEQGSFLAGRSALSASGICLVDGAPKRFERGDIVEDKPSFNGKTDFGSVDTVYFTQALAADGGSFERCTLAGSDRGGTPDDPDGSLLSVSLSYPQAKLASGASKSFRVLAYLGPKTPAELAAAGHGLRRASYVGGLPGIDAIANGLVTLLEFIHGRVIGNWGIAIILLTIFVKLALYPLTAKSFQSIAAMRRLKPSVDEINEKYANDREKKGAAMMELYRQHKINPFGGCLPQLLQLPIWWALYMSLSTNVELFRRPFFGFWQDLAAPDPYYVLPLALGALMWVQQKITPSTMDPAQAKMMLYVMPAMITSFMLFLPAGLCLYMFTNSVLSILQQKFIEHRLARKHATNEVVRPGEASLPKDATQDGASTPRRTGRGRA